MCQGIEAASCVKGHKLPHVSRATSSCRYTCMKGQEHLHVSRGKSSSMFEGAREARVLGAAACVMGQEQVQLIGQEQLQV